MSSTHQITKESLAGFEKWKQSALKMEEWFNGRTLPAPPVLISQAVKIVNVELYVSTNISTIKANQDKPWQAAFKPAYMRLYNLKKFIENDELGTANGNA